MAELINNIKSALAKLLTERTLSLAVGLYLLAFPTATIVWIVNRGAIRSYMVDNWDCGAEFIRANYPTVSSFICTTLYPWVTSEVFKTIGLPLGLGLVCMLSIAYMMGR